MPVYLDYNATTPVDERVLAVMRPYFSEIYGNASSRDHAFGWDAAEAVEDARAHVANLINAKPSEIVFTSGATESINHALKGIVKKLRPYHRILSCAAEHDAVLESCLQLTRLDNVSVSLLGVDKHGRINLAEAAEQLKEAPSFMVAIMLANNETGTIHPVQHIAHIAQQAGASFLCDITQAAGKIAVDVEREGIDLAAFSAHKLYGPKGMGALYMRGGVSENLEPLILGGGQERRLRGGTLNVPGIVGFGEACRLAKQECNDEAIRVGQLRDRLEVALLDSLPNIWINGDRTHRVANTSNIGFAGVEARTLIRDMRDIAVSTQAACSSGDFGPSHVLKAMDLTDEQAYSCVRFSLGRFTTEEEINYAIQKVINSVRKLRGARWRG